MVGLEGGSQMKRGGPGKGGPGPPDPPPLWTRLCNETEFVAVALFILLLATIYTLQKQLRTFISGSVAVTSWPSQGGVPISMV